MRAAAQFSPSTTVAICGASLGVFVVLVLGACAIEPASPTTRRSPPQALIGGTLDTGDPAVVALTRGGSSSFCTGTLISPRVILTAAHCIDMFGADPNASIFFGSDTNDSGTRLSVGAKKQHPLWTGNLSGGHDVGLLLMDFPYQDPRIARELNVTSPAIEHLGADYRQVGFGVFDRATGSADGRKRQGSTTISSIQADVIISGDSNLSVCFGDSGGPAFLIIDGVEKVAGIHSFTSGDDCFPPNGDTDVQKYAENFILPWIQENDQSCGLDGVCGPIGCTDDPDCLPCGPDGTCVSDCPLPDPDCRTQSLGDICKSATQCTSERCVAYREEPDYLFCTETCDPGNDTCPDGMSCQTVNPFGSICYFDATPPGGVGQACNSAAECGSYQCEQGACVATCDLPKNRGCPKAFACETHDMGENYYCFLPPPEEGGCHVAGSASSNFSALLLLALAAWLRRRRKSPARQEQGVG